MAHAVLTHRGNARYNESHTNRIVDETLQRRRYGGFNFGAAFFGWMVAVGFGGVLTSLLAAAGTAVAFATNSSAKMLTHQAATVGLAGGITLIAAGMISYFAGGYVAGRMSRFDGARQGVGVWLMGILLVIILGAAGAAFGSKYNALQQLNLPHIPVDQGTLTAAGLVTLAAALLLTLLAAMLGGKVGEGYHRKIDAQGAVTPRTATAEED